MSAASNTNSTLTFDESSRGWPSFYSYVPDWMIGMNNYFYTFKEGNLYRHNVNPVRNEYYGVSYDATLQSVFNDIPLENKLFKTLNVEGDSAWGVTITTDIQDTGYIERDWFVKKEGAWFAYVRNSGTVPSDPGEYALRSLNGIGNSVTKSIPSTGFEAIDFALTISIGNIVSVGDMLYFTVANAPRLAGQITEINVNLQGGINQLVIDTTVPSAIAIPSSVEYYLYIKNAVAESHGVLGHYAVFNLTNNSQLKIELFSLETEVMKSFP